MAAPLQSTSSLWTDLPKYSAHSQENGQLVFRRTGSKVRGWKQHEALRCVSLNKRGSYTILRDEPSQRGQLKAIKHMVEFVGRLSEPLPYGKYLLVQTRNQQVVSLGDGGMIGVEVVAHLATGDMSVEADDGEYLQWHTEQSMNSVWWSCREVPLATILNDITSIVGEPTDRVPGAIRLFEQSPEELPAPQVLKIARDHLESVDFLVMDYDDFSLVWMSAESPGRERQTSTYGEVSVVFSGADKNETLIKTVGRTATPGIGKRAVSIVDRLRSSEP